MCTSRNWRSCVRRAGVATGLAGPATREGSGRARTRSWEAALHAVAPAVPLHDELAAGREAGYREADQEMDVTAGRGGEGDAVRLATASVSGRWAAGRPRQQLRPTSVMWCHGQLAWSMLAAVGGGGAGEAQGASPRRPPSPCGPPHSRCCACFCSSFTSAAAAPVGEGSGGAQAGSVKCRQGRHGHSCRGASLLDTSLGRCDLTRAVGKGEGQ